MILVGFIFGLIIGLCFFMGERSINKELKQTNENLKKDIEFWEKYVEENLHSNRHPF